MDTLSDSERRRRDRRTAFEITFDETPVFSDSEDEAEYYRLNNEPLVNHHVKDKSVTENNTQLQCNTLVRDILKVCCSKCICCGKIKNAIINLSEANSVSMRSPSLSSRDSGFGMELRVFANAKENDSNNINIISDSTVKPASSVAATFVKQAILTNNNNNLKEIIDQTQLKRVSRAAIAGGGEREMQAQEICKKRGRGRPPKKAQGNKNYSPPESEEIKDKPEMQEQNIRICGQKVGDTFNPSEANSVSTRSPSLSSRDSGVGMEQYVASVKLQIFPNAKENDSNNINIISDSTVRPASSVAAASAKQAILTNNNNNLKEIIDQTQSKRVSPAAIGEGGEREMQAQEICKKRGRGRPPKKAQGNKNYSPPESEEIKDKREMEGQNIEGRSKHKRKSAKLPVKRKNSQLLYQHHGNKIQTDEQKENVRDTIGPKVKRRRTLGLSNQGNGSQTKSLLSKRLSFDNNKESQKGNTEDIRNETEKVQAKKNLQRKTMTDVNDFKTKGEGDEWPEWKTKSLITFEDYEPRRSSRPTKPSKQFSPEPIRPEDSNKKKTFYSRIDRRIFKIPIDTTNDRGFAKAIARKLARRAGSNLNNLESLSIEHESFRFQKTQKVKKLYSPEAWLNSRIFSEICECD